MQGSNKQYPQRRHICTLSLPPQCVFDNHYKPVSTALKCIFVKNLPTTFILEPFFGITEGSLEKNPTSL